MWLSITRQILQKTSTFIKTRPRCLSSLPNPKTATPQCIITCKNSKLDHYSNIEYTNLDKVPLASKGWSHAKSKNDFFTIHQQNDTPEEMIPLKALDIHPDLIQALKKQKITKATSYQARAIPAMNLNSHLLLAAETGCGKTLAYLLPIIQNLIRKNPGENQELNTPRAVVLVPNRELAYQIGEVANILAEHVGLTVKVIVGGQTKKLMMDPQFEQVDLLVATPGVVGKLSAVGVYRLAQAQYTVLDEADTLIDDSFIERMTGIIKRVSQSKIVLVTATLPKSLPEALSPIESNLHQVISPQLHKPMLKATQKFMRLTRSAKPSHLLQLVKTNRHPMLIFTNRNETCNWLAMFLRENGVQCSNINGDMNYAIRIQQWNDFIRGKHQILASTDIASRGLDTTQVKHLLNYDFPFYAADYLHRIGRIGRLGGEESCKATSFVSGPEEIRLVQQIEYAVRKNEALYHVDGNITNLVQKRIMKIVRNSA